jgi:hypothetical protein
MNNGPIAGRGSETQVWPHRHNQLIKLKKSEGGKDEAEREGFWRRVRNKSSRKLIPSVSNPR